MKELNAGYKAICESHNWAISECDGERIELSKHSPAGEDFIFTADIENFVESVNEYAADFDIDEHVEMWIEARKSGVRDVPSTRELVKDAEDINLMLKELAVALLYADMERALPEDFLKAKYLLTNSEIARGINELGDFDFYEVFLEIAKLHFGEDSDEFKADPIDEYVKVLGQILWKIGNGIEAKNKEAEHA